ncbi:MAG: tetratricopeptide repeat protein [Candidatus Obscuribacterales bacterium]|nr:tetratricopeptide repeat protein [Candidatus Obscuribacterales bacterium]
MMKQLVAFSCLCWFFGPSAGGGAVFAQGQGESDLRGRMESRRAEVAPVDESEAETGPRSKFPGMGSIDAWRSSLPELRAGNRCMKEKQWDEAIAHYKASVDLYEYQPRCWLQMGRALQRKGADVADQEKCFRKALKLDQTNWHSWKELANILYMTKRYGEARESLASAIQLNPPPQGKQELERMIKDVDSAQRGADTSGRNTGD